MPHPSLFKPLLQIDQDLISLMDRTRALTTQIRAINSDRAEELETKLIDITAGLLDIHQEIITARLLETNLRKG